MGRFAQETVEQVKAYTDIVGLVSEYVTLRKRGRNYLGLCPFHSEKTPSFTVSPEKNLWHCFGCQSSGDHISFLREIDNLTFVEAIKHIAVRAGIDIVEEEGGSPYFSEMDKQISIIVNMLFDLKEYFSSCLVPDSPAYNYIKDRGINEKTISDFSIGYSPKSFDLQQFLEKKGYKDDLILKSGVAFQTDDGRLVSRFRNRIMFPVVDYRGRTVGFGGRLFEGESPAAKYVNSEETSLFKKRRLLYGLGQAKKGIKERQSILLVEGYMDVLMCHQYGFTHAAATMGTALTSDQVQKIKRFTSTVYMALDNDNAGQKAAERSFDVLKQYDMAAFKVNLSEKDPADFLVKEGKEAMEEKLSNVISLMEFKLNKVIGEFEPFHIEKVPAILNILLPLLDSEKDNIIQRHYVNVCATRLKINEDLLMAKIKKRVYNIGNHKFISENIKKDKYSIAAEHLLCLIADDLNLRAFVLENLSAAEFKEETYCRLVELIRQSVLTGGELIESIEEAELQAVLRRVLIGSEESGQVVRDRVVNDCVETLKSYSRGKQVEVFKGKN